MEDTAEKSDTDGTAEKSDEEREITGESEGEVTSDESGEEIQDESSEVKENVDVGEEKSENDSVKEDTLLMLKQDEISSRTSVEKEKGDFEGDISYKVTFTLTVLSKRDFNGMAKLRFSCIKAVIQYFRSLGLINSGQLLKAIMVPVEI